MVKIFVYGSLRYGMYNYDKYLYGSSKYLGIGYIKGSIYQIDGKKYPAFLPEGESYIIGDIFEINEDTLKKIDKMEHYNPSTISQNEYNRIKTTVYDENKNIVDSLYTYVFNPKSSMNKDLKLTKLIEPDYIETIGKFI